MEKVKKVTLSGMLFAIGLILPFFIGQIPAVGKMLLPMHIPVLMVALNKAKVVPFRKPEKEAETADARG